MSLRRMHGNLSGATYFISFNPFLNWAKTGTRTLRRTSTDLVDQDIFNAGGYLDSNGELINPVPSDVTGISCLFFVPASASMFALGANFANETWIATWQGSAIGNIDLLSAGGSQDESVT